MTTSPRVSILIAACNAEATLAETLASIAAQTVEDWEAVLIDDGSTDGTFELARAWSRGEPRLRVVRQANRGVAATRNRLIALARARICAFCDADDRWQADHLAMHLARLDRTPALDLSFSRARFIDAAGRPTGDVARPKLTGLGPADLLAGNPTTTCSTLVFRRSVALALPFDAAFLRAEDQAWLFELLRRGHRLEGIDALSVDYRTSGSGLSADLDAMERAWEQWIAQARSRAPDVVLRHEAPARASMLRYLARRAIRLNGDTRQARRLIGRALRTAPQLLWREPRSTGLTIAAALLPQHRLLARNTAQG